MIQWLTSFLPSKGVAEKDAENRARLALKKVGLNPIEQALKGKDPWRQLKQIGNHLGKPFQWVTVSELESHIQARADHKHGSSSAVVKKKIKPAGKKDIQISLTPDSLELLAGTFEDENGDELAQVSIDSLRPDIRGVAITTPGHALSLIRGTHNISMSAFGVVTIGPIQGVEDDRLTPLQWTGIYTPTQDPVIVRGHLLCLSDVKIVRSEPDDAMELPKLDTAVLKVQIYAREYDQCWEALTNGPVKQLVSLIPALQLCSDPDCAGQCAKFHAAVDESVRNVLCDVWHWKWYSGTPPRARLQKL